MVGDRVRSRRPEALTGIIVGALAQLGLAWTYRARAVLLAASSIAPMLAPGVKELDQ